MSTTKREVGTSVKKGTSPSNSKPSPKKPSSSAPPSSSSEKQLPNYLKPTKSSRTDAALKTLKKPATEDASQNPSVLRRRSFDTPPSAARAQKPLIAPARPKTSAGATTTTTTSSSRSVTSKPVAVPKAPLERVAKKPNAPAKPQAQQMLSSSRTSHKSSTPTTSSKTKKGPSTPSSASKKPTSSPDIKEALSVETKHENKENLDHQVEHEGEVIVKDDESKMDDTETPKVDQGGVDDIETLKTDQGEVDDTGTSKPDQGEVDDIETPKADHGEIDDTETLKVDQGEADDTQTSKVEESGNTEAEVVVVAIDEDSVQVTSVVDKGGQETDQISSPVSEQEHGTDISSAVSEQQNEPEPHTEKAEDEVEEIESDHIPQHDDGDKANQIEEIIVGDDPQQENIPLMDQEATTEIEHGGEEHVNDETTKETKEEMKPERKQEDNKGSQQQGLESSKEESVQKLDAAPEAAPEAEQKVEPETEQKAEPGVEQKAEPEVERTVEPKAEAEEKVEAKVEAVTEAKADAETEEKAETKAEPVTTNIVSKSIVQGKKESATPYNHVIKETATKLIQERRNKVRALAGAFETVIAQESPRGK